MLTRTRLRETLNRHWWNRRQAAQPGERVDKAKGPGEDGLRKAAGTDFEGRLPQLLTRTELFGSGQNFKGLRAFGVGASGLCGFFAFHPGFVVR